MTWRRRLLVATATVGGGMICFQPVMRARMESRLSDIVGGRVEIGSSRISIRDGSIALRDIDVHTLAAAPTEQSEPAHAAPRTLKIQHAALKFNWKSLLYRNLTLENVVASDVRWEVTEPTSDKVPAATVIAASIPLSPSDQPATLDFDIAPIVQPLKLKMADISAKQSRDHLNVSTRIKSILERLAEFTSAQDAMNVLRQKPVKVLDDAQKELAMLQQSIAEDRLARKDSDKALDSLRQAAQMSLAGSLEIDPGVVSSQAIQAASQVAKRAVAKEWNRNRALIHAALNSISMLQPNSDPLTHERPVGKRETRANSLGLLSTLPVGLTHCVAGKANGVAYFPDVSLDSPEAASAFEIRFRNLCSANINSAENPSVTIKLTRNAQPDESPWLLCSAQHLNLPQSDARQIHFVIERNQLGGGKSITTIQHANQGWAASVSVPIASCLETPSDVPGIDFGLVARNTMVTGKMIGTTQSALSESSEMIIDIDDSSVTTIEGILSPMLRAEAEKKKAQASIRGTELLNSELLQIASRWDQLSDEHARTHGNWEASIQEVNDQLAKLKKAFTRTTRSPSPPAR